jgi:hypothetical protein
MALIACPECKKQISDSAGNCPNCGYQITPEKVAEIKEKLQQQKKNVKMGCLSLIVILFVIGFINVVFFGGNKSSNPSSTWVVKNSEWDGSVSQVKSWMKANLNDPSSLEFIKWEPVNKKENGDFSVLVRYRAKNKFGGYVVKNTMFFLNSAGTVTNNVNMD